MVDYVITQSAVGQQGVKGDAGLSINWQGDWLVSTAYVVNDAVANNGSSYICILDHTSTVDDEAGVGINTATYWDLLAERGLDGAGSGTVTSVGTGTGLLGGPITTSGSIAIDTSVVTTLTGTQTLTNKTITFADNTLTGVVGETATQTLTNKTLSGAVLNDGFTEEVFAVTGTTPALSPNDGSIQTWTLSGNSTPTAGTWAAGQSITLMVDDGTDYTITWTSLAVEWKTDAGVAPTLNTSGFTAIALWKVDTTIYGARVGDA